MRRATKRWRKATGKTGVEADLLETARARLELRSPAVIWSLLVVSIALSIVSVVRAEDVTATPALELLMLFVAVAVAVVLISAGTMALHASRESRWDAPLTVGIGTLLLGVGTFDQVLAAAAAVDNVANSSTDAGQLAMQAIWWLGLCLVVGGLVWSSKTGWSVRTRTLIISVTLATPVAVAWAWATTGATRTSAVERTMLLVLALTLVITALRIVRHDSSAPFLEGGTLLGFGLALGVIQQAVSVAPGDMASIAGLAWLLVAGLLTTLWFDRQAALRAETQRTRTERYMRLVEDARYEIETIVNDRSRLRHNGASSLTAIEGGLEALGSSVAAGDIGTQERMTRALTSEIGRLRRMLSSANVPGESPRTSLVDAVDAVVHLARCRGQLIAAHVPEALLVTARADAVAEILHTLLDNADVHAPGSVVAIEAAETDQGFVELVVQDDGAGVRSDLVHDIFERGISSRGSTGGQGLFAARALARGAGGDLELLLEFDGGCFRLLLPVAAPNTVSPLRAVGAADGAESQ